MMEWISRLRDSESISIVDHRSERLRASAERRAEEISIRARLHAFRQEEAIRGNADVATTAAEEEMAFYDHLMNEAGGSQVKQEIVLRKLSSLSAANDRRVARSFP